MYKKHLKSWYSIVAVHRVVAASTQTKSMLRCRNEAYSQEESFVVLYFDSLVLKFFFIVYIMHLKGCELYGKDCSTDAVPVIRTVKSVINFIYALHACVNTLGENNLILRNSAQVILQVETI
ncbi:hypothetical protein BD770DRAFT_408336 [Pilaira anomala]|nr:hypothetical protein BD770DRAFT_408336 [Pilaira anomala]